MSLELSYRRYCTYSHFTSLTFINVPIKVTVQLKQNNI